ncbi:unnamed protein product [Owenia fusiformis]|uniref:Uncharacterized protein n=1 Tax=Owenia fusiformis TaxID=6347 RepID=A0A8J1UW00_OWEFU|nr:unnamed protein product [Owenia fusiformis]
MNKPTITLTGLLAISIIIFIVIRIPLISRTGHSHRISRGGPDTRNWPDRILYQELKRTTEPDLGLQILRSLLKKWPSNKPKAFIYLLMNGTPEGIRRLFSGLKSVDKNYNDEFKYPIVIFHEPGVTHSQKILIQNASKSLIVFQMVEFKIPEFLEKEVPKRACSKNVGYRHMCRFHAKIVTKHPLMELFDYYMRLDDDSQFNGNIKYDLFKEMSDNSYIYGYLGITNDSPECVIGLWDAVRKHISRTSLSLTWPEPMMYYNNFEVASTKLWLKKEYQDYIEYIDKLGGIYYYRWGDAPIKSLAVSLFVPQENIHQFTDVWYTHDTLSYPTVLTLMYTHSITIIALFVIIASIMTYLLRKHKYLKYGQSLLRGSVK